MMKEFENGLSKALFEVHYKHSGFEYPIIVVTDALISQGSTKFVTKTSGPDKEGAPQLSPYEQSKVQPAIGVNMKKSVNKYLISIPPLT